jgi:hypothetical protein
MKSLSLFTNRGTTVFYDETTGQPEAPSGQQGGGDPKSTFTKEQVDELIAKDRNVYKERQRQMEQQLQQMQEKYQANTGLAEELENARNLLKTKEQLAKEEAQKLQNRAKAEQEATAKERDKWKELYTTTTIRSEVTNAAVKHGAFNPEQLFALLKDTTRLDQDPESGMFKTTVEFVDTIEGKPVPVRISVEDAVQRMVDKPDQYGNLFKTTANAGTGRNNGPNARNINPSSINSLADYMAIRQAVAGR